MEHKIYTTQNSLFLKENFKHLIKLLNSEFTKSTLNINFILNPASDVNSVSVSIRIKEHLSGEFIMSPTFSVSLISCGLVFCHGLGAYSTVNYTKYDVGLMFTYLLESFKKSILGNSISRYPKAAAWSGYSKACQAIISNRMDSSEFIWEALQELSEGTATANNPNSSRDIKTCILNLDGLSNKYKKIYGDKIKSAATSAAKSS